MFSFFNRKSKESLPLGTDIHSHLLAGIDDGVQSLEEAEAIIIEFQKLGYNKLITTPHIMSDRYHNDPGIIREKLKELQLHLSNRKIEMQIEAGAEYYLDEVLFNQVDTDQDLLTFGDRYFLFETNYLSEPYQFKEFVFKLTTQGYKPVLAHPERYHFMTMEKAEDYRNRGVLLQVNILSLLGYYSKPVQSLAYKLVDKGWVDLLGSDCHHQTHIKSLALASKNKYFKKALDLPLLNRTL